MEEMEIPPANFVLKFQTASKKDIPISKKALETARKKMESSASQDEEAIDQTKTTEISHRVTVVRVYEPLIYLSDKREWISEAAFRQRQSKVEQELIRKKDVFYSELCASLTSETSTRQNGPPPRNRNEAAKQAWEKARLCVPKITGRKASVLRVLMNDSPAAVVIWNESKNINIEESKDYSISNLEPLKVKLCLRSLSSFETTFKSTISKLPDSSILPQSTLQRSCSAIKRNPNSPLKSIPFGEVDVVGRIEAIATDKSFIKLSDGFGRSVKILIQHGIEDAGIGQTVVVGTCVAIGNLEIVRKSNKNEYKFGVLSVMLDQPCNIYEHLRPPLEIIKLLDLDLDDITGFSDSESDFAGPKPDIPKSSKKSTPSINKEKTVRPLPSIESVPIARKRHVRPDQQQATTILNQFHATKIPKKSSFQITDIILEPPTTKKRLGKYAYQPPSKLPKIDMPTEVSKKNELQGEVLNDLSQPIIVNKLGCLDESKESSDRDFYDPDQDLFPSPTSSDLSVIPSSGIDPVNPSNKGSPPLKNISEKQQREKEIAQADAGAEDAAINAITPIETNVRSKNRVFVEIAIADILLKFFASLNIPVVNGKMFFDAMKGKINIAKRASVFCHLDQSVGALAVGVVELSHEGALDDWNVFLERKTTHLLKTIGFISTITKTRNNSYFWVDHGKENNEVVAKLEIEKHHGTCSLMISFLSELMDCIEKKETVKSTFLSPSLCIICKEGEFGNPCPCKLISTYGVSEVRVDDLAKVPFGCRAVFKCSGVMNNAMSSIYANELSPIRKAIDFNDLAQFDIKKELQMSDDSIPLTTCSPYYYCTKCLSEQRDKLYVAKVMAFGTVENSPQIMCRSTNCNECKKLHLLRTDPI